MCQQIVNNTCARHANLANRKVVMRFVKNATKVHACCFKATTCHTDVFTAPLVQTNLHPLLNHRPQQASVNAPDVEASFTVQINALCQRYNHRWLLTQFIIVLIISQTCQNQRNAFQASFASGETRLTIVLTVTTTMCDNHRRLLIPFYLMTLGLQQQNQYILTQTHLLQHK